MSSNKRKAFHFDLDEKKLKQFYSSKSGTGYKNAWGDIGSYMKKNGFEHAQYSGYESTHAMPQYEAIKIIENLNKKFPWFEQCAQAGTITDIGKRYDVLSHLREHTPVEEPPIPEAELDTTFQTHSLDTESDKMRKVSQELFQPDDPHLSFENAKNNTDNNEYNDNEHRD